MMRRRSKYGNRKTVVDGITFDSAKEAWRWQELKLLEKVGEVTHLERQVPFALHVRTLKDGALVKVGKLTLDFVYQHFTGPVYEDVKSPITRTETSYRLRKRMFEAEYSATILET